MNPRYALFLYIWIAASTGGTHLRQTQNFCPDANPRIYHSIIFGAFWPATMPRLAVIGGICAERAILGEQP